MELVKFIFLYLINHEWKFSFSEMSRASQWDTCCQGNTDVNCLFNTGGQCDHRASIAYPRIPAPLSVIQLAHLTTLGVLCNVRTSLLCYALFPPLLHLSPTRIQIFSQGSYLALRQGAYSGVLGRISVRRLYILRPSVIFVGLSRQMRKQNPNLSHFATFHVLTRSVLSSPTPYSVRC